MLLPSPNLVLSMRITHLTHRLLEAVREPPVAQHSQHRGGWVLQILKSIHEDEIQHNIKETHADHLSESRTARKGNGFKKRKWTSLFCFEATKHDELKFATNAGGPNCVRSVHSPQRGAGQETY